MKKHKQIFKTLDALRYWTLNNGFHDWTAQINDVMDAIIILERDLQETKEKYERLLLQTQISKKE